MAKIDLTGVPADKTREAMLQYFKDCKEKSAAIAAKLREGNQKPIR